MARANHWIHLVSVLLLIYTGLALYVKGTNFLAVSTGGFYTTRIIHRVAATAFICAPLVSIILYWSAFKKWLPELLSWGNDDTAWAMRFPLYFFRPSAKMPRVHAKGTAGERVIAWVMLTAALVQAVTGLILWFRPFTENAVLWATFWHDIGFFFIAVPLLFHIYVGLGIFKPYRGVWRGMLGNGTIDEKLAEHLWPDWTAEQKNEQTK